MRERGGRLSVQSKSIERITCRAFPSPGCCQWRFHQSSNLKHISTLFAFSLFSHIFASFYSYSHIRLDFAVVTCCTTKKARKVDSSQENGTPKMHKDGSGTWDTLGSTHACHRSLGWWRSQISVAIRSVEQCILFRRTHIIGFLGFMCFSLSLDR